MAKKPNILVIQADQLTSEVLSSYGKPVAKTPNMDRLAAEGMVFRNAYCSVPLCGPSRMSMLSGQLASTVCAWDNAAEFSAEVPTFAHYLRALGYHTTLSGKMHFVGPDQLHGFEERLTTDIYPSDFYWTETLESRDGNTKSDDRGVRDSGICDRSPQLDFDELAMFKAEQYLWDLARRDGDQPFFLFVSLTHPHDPYYCTQEYFDRYTDDEIPMPTVGRIGSQAADPLTQYIMTRHELDKDFDPAVIRKSRRAYLGSVSYIDDQVGRLMRILKSIGADEDTVVLLIGDHGEMLGERGMWFKRHFYEWSARVPMIWWAPDRVRKGERFENVSLMDMLPTFLNFAGDAEGSSLVEPVQGRDLLPLMEGRAQDFDNVVYGEVMSDGLSSPVFMIRRDAWKLIEGPTHPAQLYNLAVDPNEETDLGQSLGDHVPMREALQAELRRVWDADRIQADIELSLRRRMLVRSAHLQGKAPNWDYDPGEDDAERWCRSGSNYNAWSFNIVNPR